MLPAPGRNQASGNPSLSGSTCAPWTWVTRGTGPVYGPGVLVKTGRESTGPGGFAQCSVGSMGRRWGRKLLLASTSSLRQVTCAAVPCRTSTVGAGQAKEPGAPVDPYAQIFVAGKLAGRTCWT